MDNHPFQNGIHVFIAQQPDNDVDAQDIPQLVPLQSIATEPQQQTTTDVEMNNHDSESDRDAREVEMQTVNDNRSRDHVVPNPSHSSHTSQDQPAVNNRRARVEDDEDEDRDRRHPSQRIGNSPSAPPSAGPSSSTPVSFPSQMPTTAPQQTPGARLRGQAPIFTRTAVDETPTTRAHPFRFFQHLMSSNNNNSDNNDTANPPHGGPVPAPQPHQDGNRSENHPHGRHPINIEGFSVTLDIGVGPAFRMGAPPPQPQGQPTPNADRNPNLNPNPNPNPNIQNGNINVADFMARLSEIMGLGENGDRPAAAPTAPPPGGNNPDQGAGDAGPGAIPGAQFGFNIPPGAFNIANLAGLGFGFNFDGSGFAEKEDPERARKLVDGLEEVPVGLVKRLERVGGTGGGMGEDETKGGDGGCAICWDRLLGDSAEEDVHQHGESEPSRPEASTNEEEAPKLSVPKIVSLPCAHVFHAECLIPWFSRPRQTTCPTCRFNIDPENLTYVSWRRRMRERREREREDARARGDTENVEGNEINQDGNTPAATAAAPAAGAEPTAAPLSEPTPSSSPPQVRSRTPGPSVLNAHPRPTPRSQSQPPSVQGVASSSSPSSSSSSSQPSTQTVSSPEGGATHWHADIHAHAPDDWDIPQLQDVSDSEEEDDDEDEDDEGEDGDEEDEGQENGRGIQFPHEAPIASSASAAQARTGQPRHNDPLAPRTIQTAHGLVTLIPVPFNFPFLAAGNGPGVGVGVQASANAQAPVTANQGQGRPPNINANTNTQARANFGPYLHFHLPHMPEFGAQRAAALGTPAPTTTTAANANANQAVPADPLNQDAAIVTNAEEEFMHLLSQGLTADEVENLRQLGRQVDGDENGNQELEQEDDMMDIDEGMGMVVDLTMNGENGEAGIDADPAAIAAQDEQDRHDFMNFLARYTEGQARAGAQTQGQTQQQEQGTQAAAAGGNPRAPSGAPQPPQQPQEPQPQQQQQQGQGFAPFMPGLNPSINIGNLGPDDGRMMNDIVTRIFAGLTGGPRQQARRQAQPAQGQGQAHPAQEQAHPAQGQAHPAQGQDRQPQPQGQPQPQAGQGRNPGNANNNGRRQAQFAFGNVTIGPVTNLGAFFSQFPIFDPNVNGTGQERVKKAWTLPPAPGPTLRQRIERRERDAGLRCCDVSCGVGPSDEDPVVNDETIAFGMRQLMIMSKNHGSDGKTEGVCKHTFHPGCLVSAERVALGGADVSIIEGGDVEVSCPVCRSAGCVTKQEWDEGISALS